MQVQENVNVSNFLLVGNQTRKDNISIKNDNNQVNDFAKCLSDSNVETTSKQANVSDNDKKDVTIDESPTIKEINSSVLTEKVEVVKETIESDIIENSILSEEDQEILLELFGNILQMITNEFQLSGEELISKLKEFDIKPLDLLNPDKLKEFFLNMNSSDVSNLISNEKLNADLNQFMNQLNTLIQNSNLSLEELKMYIQSDDFAKLFNDFDNLEDALKDVNFDELINKPVIDNNASNTQEINLQPKVVVSDENQQNNSQMDDNVFQQSYNKQSKDTTTNLHKNQKLELEDNLISNHEETDNPIVNSLKNFVSRIQDIVKADQPVESREIVNQIVEQIKLNLNQETTSMELQLYPEHLGKIQINVVSKDGIMTARIAAETETAKQAIESGLSNLKETLQNQDLKVDAIEVMVSTAGFEKGNENQKSFEDKKSSSQRRKIDLSELDDDYQENQQAQIDRMEAEGSSVSFTA